MKYTLKDTSDGIDKHTGLAKGAKGGTEMMYDGLMSRLSDDIKNKYQIICSRVRDIDKNKKQILWLHDMFNDPEATHLNTVQSRERFAKLVFVSNYQFNTYHLGLGVPFSGSVVLPNAIDPFKEKIVKPNHKDRLNLIYHTTPHRGLNILVPVFIELAKRYDHIHLDVFSSFSIYGWNDRDKEFEHLFKMCEDHPQITYHGARPNREVRDYLKRAHIFAYPNIWPETSCIAAIEAMAAGVTILAPDLGALPETLSTFGYTYRFDENLQVHANRFGSILNKMIESYPQESMKQTSENGIKFANQMYSWDFRIQQWNNLFDSIE